MHRPAALETISTKCPWSVPMRHSLVLCLALLLGACASKPAPQFRQHTLEYSLPRPQLSPLHSTVRVVPFGIVPELRTPAMVHSRPFTRTEAALDRWRALPSALAADFLRRDLAASGLFAAVLTSGSFSPADYLVEGFVEVWDVMIQGTERQARLGLTVTLVDARAPLAQAVLFQRRYDETEPFPETGGSAVAQAMSQAMARASARILEDVHRAITARGTSAATPR